VCVGGSQIVQVFQLHHHTCCIYLGSVLVDEYGDEPNFVPPLLDMLQVNTAHCLDSTIAAASWVRPWVSNSFGAAGHTARYHSVGGPHCF